MESETKTAGGSRFWRVVRRVLLAAGLFFIVLVVGAYVFLQSRYPASFITYAFRRASGMELSMEGLTIGPWLRLSMKGLRVESGGKTLLRASRLDVKVDPVGGLDGRVLSLSLGNPVVFVGALASGGSGARAPVLAIPWFLRGIEVRDALVYRGEAPVAGATALVGPLTVRIRAITGSRAAFLADAYLPLLKTTASIGAELDMSAMGIHGGQVSLGTLRIEDLGAGGLPIVRGGEGTIKPELRFQRKDGALTASFRGDFWGVRLPGLPLGGPARGRLTASVAFDRAMSAAEIRGAVFLKEHGSGRAAYRAAVLRGRYDIRKRDLEIKDAAITVPSIGAVHLRGALHRAFEEGMAVEADLSIDDFALPVLNGPILKPLSVEALGGGRGLRGSASLKGRLYGGLDWGLDMRVESRLRRGPYVLDLAANSLRIRAEGVYSVKDDVLKIGVMKAGLGRAGEVALKGAVAGLRTGEPVLDLGVRGAGVDLRALRGAVSGPLMPGVSMEGRARAAVFLRGPIDGLRLHGGATLGGLGIEGRGLGVRGGKVSLEIGFEDGRLRFSRLSGVAASVEMRVPAPGVEGVGPGRGVGSGDSLAQGAIARALGVGFGADSVSYANGVFGAEGLRLNAKKGHVSGLFAGPSQAFRGAALTIRSARYEGGRLRAEGLRADVKRAFPAGEPLAAAGKARAVKGRKDRARASKDKAAAGRKPLGASRPELIDMSLALRSLAYGREGLGAEGLEFGMEKALFVGPGSGPRGGRLGAKESGLVPRFIGTGLSVKSLTLRDGRLGTRGVRLGVRKALLMRGGRVVAREEKISMEGALEGDIAKKEFSAGKFAFSMRGGGGTGGAGAGAGGRGLGLKGEIRDISISLSGPLMARGSLEIKDIRASELAHFLAAGSGLEVSGLLGARAAINVVSGPAQTRLRASLGLMLSGGAFSSADGELAAEGLGVKTGGDISLDLTSMKAAFSMNAEAGGFELLAGSFYGSFKERPVKVSVRGAYDGEKDELSIGDLALAMEPVGRLSLSGQVRGATTPDPDLDILLGPMEISNRAAFDFFIRDTFKETLPALAGLEVDGRTGLRLHLRGRRDGLLASGEVTVRGGAVRERDGSGYLKDIEITLPVDLVYPPGKKMVALEGAAAGVRAKVSAGEAPLEGEELLGTKGEKSPATLAARDGDGRRPGTSSLAAGAPTGHGRRGRTMAMKKSKERGPGSLRIGEVSWAGIEVRGLAARPIIRKNTLNFDGDVVVPLFGGTVSLGDIVYSDLLGPSPELSLYMDVEGLDLKEASAALGLPPFEGEVSGSIPGIKLAGGELTTDGEIRLRIFGGEVTLTHMAVGEVFSPVPSFRTNLEIKDLDLGALTGAFEFGTITGILEGSVRDLVVVRGQPESFFIDIKTVQRRGVPQRISTKALENVSILGTGAAASVLNRGIYRLFDEYRYSKMGFQAQLKNDELILLGIETQGDKGYIIKGAKFPPKVDVVSHTERISFREMMRRLERVGFSGAGETGRETEKN